MGKHKWELAGGKTTLDGAGKLKPREEFGNYQVFERLGMGGMATVHRAIRRGIEGFEQVVALKRLLPHLAEDQTFVDSFIREAKLASMLQHQRIIQIYDLGRVDVTYFIAMEHIQGSDLRELLRCAYRVAGPPPLDVTLSILSDLCEGLDYAHTRVDKHGEPLGLVHRDVSPSNLLVAEAGNLKIIDFGIAKAASAELRTDSGRVKGKCPYMSPEAVQGQTLDARSDIFSTGVIAHELLTARPLFASKNEYETLTKVQYAEAFPPSVSNPECPLEVDDVVLKALEKDPEQRWSTAAEMREAFQEAARQQRIYPSNRMVASWLEKALDSMARGKPTDVSDAIVTRVSRVSKAVPVTISNGVERVGGGQLPDEEVVRIVWGKSGGESQDGEGDGGLPTADDLEIPLPPVSSGRVRRASTPPVFGPELLDQSKVVDAPPPGEVVNITFRTPTGSAGESVADDGPAERPTQRKLVLRAMPTPVPGSLRAPSAPPIAADDDVEELDDADLVAVPRAIPTTLSVPVVIAPIRMPSRAPTAPPAPPLGADAQVPPLGVAPAGRDYLVIALVGAITIVGAAIVYTLLN